MGEAKQIIDGMRLSWRAEKKEDFAAVVEFQREKADGLSRLPEDLTRPEAIVNLKTLVRILGRAKKLILEHEPYGWEMEDLPLVDVPQATAESITFACKEYLPEDLMRSNQWPLLILNSFEKHYAESLAELEAAPKIRQPSQRLMRIHRVLYILALHCRTAGIKISSSERSQFYRLAAYVLPDISDLRYRIRKVVEELNAKGKGGVIATPKKLSNPIP